MDCYNSQTFNNLEQNLSCGGIRRNFGFPIDTRNLKFVIRDHPK